MLLEQKKTFKEFSESNESIAPSILSDRLKKLEKIKYLVKVKPPDNNKTNLYFLTEKGLSLTPVIMELVLWSHNNIKPIVDISLKAAVVDIKDKKKLHQAIVKRYKEKAVSL